MGLNGHKYIIKADVKVPIVGHYNPETKSTDNDVSLLTGAVKDLLDNWDELIYQRIYIKQGAKEFLELLLKRVDK